MNARCFVCGVPTEDDFCSEKCWDVLVDREKQWRDFKTHQFENEIKKKRSRNYGCELCGMIYLDGRICRCMLIMKRTKISQSEINSLNELNFRWSKHNPKLLYGYGSK